MRSISLQAGLNKNACACTLSGRRWPKAEQALADFLGVSVRELFPDRYPQLTRRQGSASRSVRKVKSQQRTLTRRREAPDKEAA